MSDELKGTILGLEAAVRDLRSGIEDAWGVIANVSGGNWDQQSSEWRDAATAWRDSYTQMSAMGPEIPRRKYAIGEFATIERVIELIISYDDWRELNEFRDLLNPGITHHVRKRKIIEALRSLTTAWPNEETQTNA